MASPRGWTYTSYEAILVHMDAFSRFQISLCFPSFRNLDTLLPTKINKLEIGWNLHVDDVEIKLDRIRREAPDSEERQNVWRDLQRTQAESEKQTEILKYADDKRMIKKIIDGLKRSIARLEREHAKLKPTTLDMFQTVGIRKDHDQQVIGTVVKSENMWIGPSRKYFVENFFTGNYRINTVDVNSWASSWFQNHDFLSDFALLKTAKFIIVHHCFLMSLHSFVVLPHKRVYWNSARSVDRVLELLIKEWQRNNFPIGKRFTMPKELKRDVGMQFEIIETLPGARKGVIIETR